LSCSCAGISYGTLCEGYFSWGSGRDFDKWGFPERLQENGERAVKLKYITTLYESCGRKCMEKEIPFEENYDIENLLINLYPQVTYQTFEGFGGALTDSAGYIYSQMNKDQKKEVLDQYFGMDNMGYRQVRIPIDSCDFSLEHYEADGEEEDEGFQHFSLERVGKYIFPLLEDAEKAYG